MFLILPKEIRITIYKHLLASSITNNPAHTQLGRHNEMIYIMPTNILQVNRQCYTEAHWLAFQNNDSLFGQETLITVVYTVTTPSWGAWFSGRSITSGKSGSTCTRTS